MSKNKNYTNYNNYRKNEASKEETVDEVVVDKTSVVVAEGDKIVSDAIVQVKEEKNVEQPKKVESKTTKGEVVGCKKLRIRKAPSTEASVICELEQFTEVVVDKSSGNRDFYSITTKEGIRGYCMKKFIEIK